MGLVMDDNLNAEPPAKIPAIRWTREEDEKLMRMFEERPNSQLAFEFDAQFAAMSVRSRVSVTNRRQELRIKAGATDSQDRHDNAIREATIKLGLRIQIMLDRQQAERAQA